MSPDELQIWLNHFEYHAEHPRSIPAALDDLLSADDPKSGPPLARSFSLHNEFPDVFNRLLTSPIGTEVDLAIQSRHLPLFVAGRAPASTAAWSRRRSTAGLPWPHSSAVSSPVNEAGARNRIR